VDAAVLGIFVPHPIYVLCPRYGQTIEEILSDMPKPDHFIADSGLERASVQKPSSEPVVLSDPPFEPPPCTAIGICGGSV
jgi:hypothetical protein